MNLRAYQNRALAELAFAFKSGKRAPLLISPCGSGKTVMLSRVASGHVAKGGTVNWYAHRRELIAQAAKTLTSFGLVVGHQGLNPSAPVQVTSVQTALAQGQVREASLNIFDEAHHFAADDWGRLTDAHRSALILGATATPERGDGRGLDMFDVPIVVAQVSELIALGHLVPFEVIDPGRLLPRGKIAQKPVDAYRKYAPGSSAVVFAPHVKAAEEFADQFRDKGIEAVVVEGGTSAEARALALSRFDEGSLRVLINVYVLTEGWDCPRAECVIIARSIGSAGMYIQSTSRAGRPFPGKTRALILDLRGACRNPEIGRPDEDREYSLDGVGISRAGVVGPRRCGVCKLVLDPGVSVCPECGHERELKSPEVTGDPLVKYEFIRRDDEAMRAARLGKWIRVLRAKKIPISRAIGSASHKYKAVYGDRPTSAIVSAALRVMG